MNRTVDQMLDVARLEDSRLQLNFARADLAACVREAASTVRVLHADSHPVVVRADAPVHLDFDQIRIATVVGNLVSNAVKYSPAGSRIAVNLEAGEHEATVAVADRGIGIKPDDLPRLFTRFGRINDPRSRGVPGTGLGLYLSRELARLHGGDITVVSEPGQGSTFTLRLPVTRTPGGATSAAEARPTAASRPQRVAS
jgi:signal transduction histidine kinase